MQTITTVAELRRTLAKAGSADQRVGFVPTMGYLHDGHLALIVAVPRQHWWDRIGSIVKGGFLAHRS